MKIGNRHYNNLIKEAYWWVVERFSNPNIFKTRRFKKAVIHSAKETGRIKREYEISASTKETKKHMKEVDKTEGKPNTWEEDVAEGIKIVPALGKLLERLNKTKGRLKK